MPALSEGAIPSPDTITGAFIRDVEGRIAELEADPSDAATLEASELRDVLRLGRLLLAGHEVTPVRITRSASATSAATASSRSRSRPGLTIVHGPNEAGKTTIQRALELVLTRKVTAGGQEMDGFRSWDAPDDARPVIAIDFEVDDDDNGGGPRPGSIEKSFRGQRGTVRLELDGQVITDPTLADQALAELTGIPTEAFFRSTASIRHHELADLDRDEATLRDRLQASISGADRGTSRAQEARSSGRSSS